MVNQFLYLAEAVSTIKGELLCTQVATQHNRGSGYVHNANCEFTKQQYMNQQKQMSCHSNCFTMPAVDHYLSTHAPNHHNAILKYTNWYYFCQETNYHVHLVFLTMDGESHRRFYYIVSNVAIGPGQLFHCDACPGDVLQIVYIQNILVHLPLKVQIVTKSEQMYAEVIADNFKQDCKMSCLMRSIWTELY